MPASYGGRAHVPLDGVGFVEATELARLFCLHHSSGRDRNKPITTGVDDCGSASGGHGSAQQVIDDRLIDRDYGQWSGVSAGEATQAEFGSLDDAPGVEGMSSVASRAMAALADVPSMWSKGPAAVIAHDAVNCRILAEVSAGPAGIIQRTGCWNLLVRSGEGWSAPVVSPILVMESSDRRTHAFGAPPRFSQRFRCSYGVLRLVRVLRTQSVRTEHRAGLILTFAESNETPPRKLCNSPATPMCRGSRGTTER